MNGQYQQRVVALGVNADGTRSCEIERLASSLKKIDSLPEHRIATRQRHELVQQIIPEMIRRDLAHNGLLSDTASLSLRLLAWIELGSGRGLP